MILCIILVEEQIDETFKLFINPLDPTILAIVTTDGDEIFAYGNKTTDGLPESLSEFKVVDKDGIETYVELDDEGRVSTASDSEGNKLDLTWEDDNRLFISVVLGNGTEQLTLHVNLSDIKAFEDSINDSLDIDLETETTQKRSVPVTVRRERNDQSDSNRMNDNRKRETVKDSSKHTKKS